MMHHQRQAWLVLVVVIGAHAAFNLFFSPVGAGANNVSERVALPLMGAMLAQQVVFATWAALGPGPASMRIPLTFAASIAVSFAGACKLWNVFTHHKSMLAGQELIMDMALFGISLTIMLAARWIIGWRISASAEKVVGSGANQFNLRYLIGLTTICAGLLVVGRVLLAGEHWFRSEFWNQIANGFIFLGALLLALFPLLILPLIAVAQHPSKRTLAAMPFLWLGLTWLMIEILSAQYGEPRADTARALTLIQSGTLVASLLSAVALRYAGYRLFSNNRRSSQESVASA
jgi:hypothetical protein